MNWLATLNTLFAPQVLTRTRVVLTVGVAVLADLLQVVLLPVSWTFVQEAIDVVAMLLTMGLIGFHLLLLPTFVVEFIPVVDMLPTWTGCVIAVIALRKRAERSASAQSPSPAEPPATIQLPPPTHPDNSDHGTLPR